MAAVTIADVAPLLQEYAVSAASCLALMFAYVAWNRASSSSLHFVSGMLAPVLSWGWLGLVSRIVPEPYLDEIFHIPQAQKYCEGKYREWDDKITTPPGLYFVSISMKKVADLIDPNGQHCDPWFLRMTNVAGLCLVGQVVMLCRTYLEKRPGTFYKEMSIYSIHTSFNVAMFPLLFFFSGLYYTDVLSTLVVLLSFINHIIRVRQSVSGILSDLTTVMLGLVTLWFRQTNVFWVVVFMGGLEAVHAIKSISPKRVEQPVVRTLFEQLKFFAWRYSLGEVHDLSLNNAYPDDMLFTVISLAIAVVCNPIRVIRQIWPYVVVLGSFAGFVYWNGSVVLGDKSNHVATIHFAQLLYIWPFFAFFSWPLLLPGLLRPFQVAAYFFPGNATTKPKAAPTTDKSFFLRAVAGFFNYRILWPYYLVGTAVVSFLVVKFNTIIHPFTLADNRHYMFYIFRYTIRRSEMHRILLILPYTLARWLVWDGLGGFKDWTDTALSADESVNYPFWIATDASKHQVPQTKQDAKTEKTVTVEEAPNAATTVTTSTALIFLLATALSLVTAPLVEPRYFIIPWVMWRILLPSWSIPLTGTLSEIPMVHILADALGGYDPRLVLETLWYLAISAVTGYIFLFKGYVWKAEDGTILEGGQLQRFMW